MRSHSHRKAYALILGLGLTGLAVDKLLLSDSGLGVPASASAMSPAIRADAVIERLNLPAAEQRSLAARLDAIGRMIPDARTTVERSFDMSKLTRPAPAVAIALAEPEEATPRVFTPSEAALFESRHRLEGLMVPRDGVGGVAIVSGRQVRIGDDVDGFRLVELQPRSAWFIGHGGAVVLQLK